MFNKTRPSHPNFITALITAYTLGASAAPDSINFNWRFAKGDQAAAIQPSFDDSKWEQVDLPHDWAISGPFGKPTDHGGQAKLPWHGEGWYRKQFKLPAGAAGKRLQFVFDGVMASPTVYLNGQKVGSWIYGYNSFHIDATDAAKPGTENILTVHADTRDHFSRWYPGGGIYRKITMRLVDPVHIPVWGIHVTTPQIETDRATARVNVEVRNDAAQAKEAQVETRIIAPDGTVAGEGRKPCTIAPFTLQVSSFQFQIPSPALWELETPNRYTAKSTVYIDGKAAHEQQVNFGFRTIDWTADKGLFLNGRRVQIQGVNMHHDHGPLGAAFYPRAMERQLEILKEMGVNSIRTSHNAPAPELLEMCDRMGLLVYDELFDKYGLMSGVRCTPAEYVDQYAEAEIRNFMRRDRNHPCIYTWSIANENGAILRNEDGKAPQHVQNMVACFKKYDTTRPITMGCNNPSAADKSKKILDALDTVSWNYQEKFLTSLENYPDKATCFSESASAFGTRGAYKLKLPEHKTDYSADGECNAFILTAAPWADIPEVELDRMIRYPFVAGEYVWSGFDYLGEPTPYIGKKKNGKGINPDPNGVEARSSYFGIIDLVGFPKDTYYLYRSYWRPQETTVHLAPHWNWETGDKVPAMLYTDGDEAELFLNGKSLGRRKKGAITAGVKNLAFAKTARASSEEIKQDKKGNVQAENFAYKAVDGNLETRWCAESGTTPQHWQVDLSTAQPFKGIRIHWEQPAERYDFTVEHSRNGKNWKTVEGEHHNIGKQSLLTFPELKTRQVRITINATQGHHWASIAEVEVLPELTDEASIQEPLSNPYYDIVRHYRLCWFDIPYEAGELRAVAYKKGKRIGETIVQTAGKPAALRLTPDRAAINADGMDLCYVTIEMVDTEGRVCPRAMDNLTFDVKGSANLVGVGNGNPMGHDPFTDNTHPLFYGKAMAILRSRPGTTGSATIKVTADNGLQAALEINTEKK